MEDVHELDPQAIVSERNRQAYASALCRWLAKTALAIAAKSAALLVLGKHVEWFAHEYKEAVRSSNAPRTHIYQLHSALLKGLDLGFHRERVLGLLEYMDVSAGLATETSLPPLTVDYCCPDSEVRFWKRRFAANRVVELHSTIPWYTLAIKGAKVILGGNREWDIPEFATQYIKTPPKDNVLLDLVTDSLELCEKKTLQLCLAANRLVEMYSTSPWHTLAIKGAKVMIGGNRKWDIPAFATHYIKTPPKDDMLLASVTDSLESCEQKTLQICLDANRLVKMYSTSPWQTLAIKGAEVMLGGNRPQDIPAFVTQCIKTPPKDNTLLDSVTDSLEPCERKTLQLCFQKQKETNKKS
jgi:hypothetical protein